MVVRYSDREGYCCSVTLVGRAIGGWHNSWEVYRWWSGTVVGRYIGSQVQW